MEHDLELISPILEIVDRTIHIQSYPGNIGSYDPYISPILEIVDRTIHISVLSWKYWIVRSIYQSYPGNSGSYDPISPHNIENLF